MNYRIEIHDTWGRRIATLREAPLLEVIRRQPGGEDAIRGILPASLGDLGPGYRIRVYLEDELCCDAVVQRVEPHWGMTRKLILDRFVHFREVIEIEARKLHNNPKFVAQDYADAGVREIARDLINRAPGNLHYTIAHAAYPDGAVREYDKFDARKTAGNELEIGGISAGQWVGGARLDAANAYAKDGKTIAGLEVDGAPWPDVRLQFIWCEETAHNAAAIARHPETGGWTAGQYANSAYKLAADASQAALQDLIDNNGIDYIELNPHTDALGDFDARVDSDGRYVGLVFGNGECLNAAMLELGAAEVDLAPEGLDHAPELAPKDFFSYAGAHADSITAEDTQLEAFHAQGTLFESLLALSYCAPRAVAHVDAAETVHLRDPLQNARVVYFQPRNMGISWGTRLDSVVNLIHFEGHPAGGPVELDYSAPESIAEFGAREADFPFHAISEEADADILVPRLLGDLAYPEVTGTVMFMDGSVDMRVGDLVEVRGAPVRRTSRALPGEWEDQYPGRMIGLVREVRHTLSGKYARTEAVLTSPQRSIADPLKFMLQSQAS